MRPPSSPLQPSRDWLDRIANKQPKRRCFLATALASAVSLALQGCETPTFDSDTTTFTFRRRSPRGGERN